MENAYKNAENRLRFWFKWIIPIMLIVCISVLKFFPSAIEEYYSTGYYIGISRLMRSLTGWCGFSLGDFFYFIVGLWLFISVIKGIKSLIKKQVTFKSFGKGSLAIIKDLMWVYIWFNILWGLNYNRLGIEYQLQLTPEKYSKDDLEDLTCDLIEKVNTIRRTISTDTILPEQSFKEIFNKSIKGYATVEQQYPFLKYRYPSIKRSLYSKAGSYFGFTGYYNPFSGEAQIRDDVPRILVPYITTHEMAHQIGYAGESEANFVGYLACANVDDAYFKYSVYMDLYKYAATELFLKDLKTTHGWELDSLVRKDIRKINRFFDQRRNKVSPIMNSVYDSYLKANQQDKGIDSYNDVVGWLIAYKKKYGKI